jgi:hypothetical protein
VGLTVDVDFAGFAFKMGFTRSSFEWGFVGFAFKLGFTRSF